MNLRERFLVKEWLLIVTFLVVGGLFQGAFAAEASVGALPPSVVKTVPQCGELQVSTDVKEIRVTFSKDMQTQQMWSWCMQSPETFPEITDKQQIRFLADKRTCVLPVKLLPGKTYIIWINTQNNNAFRDLNGQPAIPYLLVFQTK